MIQELNFKQVSNFILLLLTLQKKNTFFGFLIGLVPMLVTAFAIELFIGKIIGGELKTSGIKAVNVLFFIFFTNAISQSTEAIKNYGQIIKNSYLQPTTVLISELSLQYFSFIISFLIIALFFHFSIFDTILLLVLSLVLVIYTIVITNYLLVVSSVLEDFNRVLGIVFQMLFWLSPILYSIRIIDPTLAFVFMANPFYIFFELIYLILIPQSFNPNFFWWGLLSFSIFPLLLMLTLRKLRKKIIVFL